MEPPVSKIKALTLNCQHGFRLELFPFFEKMIEKAEYDFLLLQEADRNVQDAIKHRSGGYSLVASNHFDNHHTQTAILVRNDWQIESSQTHEWMAHFGLTTAECSRDGERAIVSSIHSDFFWPWKRRRQTKMAKKILLEKGGGADLLILGGDFNSALPGEIRRNDNLLKPEFCNVTDSLAFTYDSRYIEPGGWFTDLILFLARFGFSLRLKPDHIYISPGPKIASRAEALPVRISDHVPVSITIFP